jgi:hypothetical protein
LALAVVYTRCPVAGRRKRGRRVHKMVAVPINPAGLRALSIAAKEAVIN